MRKIEPKFRASGIRGGVPGLNLASMPDLIFTVLFFFMIVTHMRDDDLKVRYQVPAGSEVRKVEQKTGVINLYIGDDGRIQIDDDIVTLDGIVPYINKVRATLSPENAERLTVSLKADRHTPMGTIADVKHELQKAYSLKINYSGNEATE